MKFRLLFGGSLLAGVLFLVPPSALASSSKAVLPATDTASTNYYAAGQTVEVTGNVESDVMVVGGNVTVTGEVGGDVLVVGGNVRVVGPVTGNIRVLGGTVELIGSVGHNVLVAAGSFTADERSHINGHLTAAAGSLKLKGIIEGSVLAAGGDVGISGNVKGPIQLWLGRDGTLQVASTAVTEAEFTYHAAKQATIVAAAKLALSPDWQKLDLVGRGRGRALGFLVTLFSSLALGLVVVGLLPKKVLEVAEEAIAHPWHNLGRGALWALVIPVVSIILLLTIIGLPLAGVLLAVYFIGALVAQVVVGATVGWWLRSRPQFKFMQTWSTLLLVLVGITLYRLLTCVPFLGGLVSLLATLCAWGALLQVQRRTLTSFK